MPGKYRGGSSARLMWLIATADTPLTARELEAELDTDVHLVSIQTTVLSLWRAGFLVRRRRGGGGASCPYEYAVAARDDYTSADEAAEELAAEQAATETPVRPAIEPLPPREISLEDVSDA